MIEELSVGMLILCAAILIIPNIIAILLFRRGHWEGLYSRLILVMILFTGIGIFVINNYILGNESFSIY